MKRILLIGDSIRMGYEPTVRQELAGLAEIASPEHNGGTSANVLLHLDEWAIARPHDIVHLNCGLHDLRREPGAADSFLPLDQYRANVERILRRLQTETSAQLIWALTTPVNEEWHHARKPFDRREADVAAYNDAAREVCAQLGVPMNDLYTLVMQAGRDTLLGPDGVHFTAEGYRLLGSAVAARLRVYL